MKAIQAIGNAPITKAIGNLMQGLADAKQVLGTIVGSFLGPEAKLALKVSYLSISMGQCVNWILLHGA